VSAAFAVLASAIAPSTARAADDRLVRLARVAERYRDTGLNFTCRESISCYDCVPARQQFSYVFVHENGRLRIFRTAATDTISARRGQEADPAAFGVRRFLESATLFAFVFLSDRQPMYSYFGLGEDKALGRSALKIGFQPKDRIVIGKNDWAGVAWIDRDTGQILRVEAWTPENWNAHARREQELAGAELRDPQWKGTLHTIESVVVEFDFEHNGMRFPTKSVMSKTESRVLGGRRDSHLEERERLRVTQEYSDYEFFAAEPDLHVKGEQAAESERQFAQWVEDGRGHLAAGRLQEAVAALGHALSIKKDLDVEALLLASQTRLVDETRGKEAEIAGAPSSTQAPDPRTRPVTAPRDAVEKLLQQGRAALDGGKVDDALQAFNRVLAIDPKNSVALESVARVYQGINRELLGRSKSEKLPPSIRFLDEYNARDGGGDLRAVDAPHFPLSGLIVSQQSAAELTILTPAGTPAAAIPVVDSTVGALHVGSFRTDVALASGMNTVTILAKETGGAPQQSATFAYRIRYDRPWSRSPWLYGGLAIAGVGGASGIVLRRNRRRRGLLERRFNPFVAGAPVMSDELFLGREALIARILQSVHNNSILLYGERRIGKTSIQHRLKRRLRQMQDPEFDFFPVYIDLEGTPEDRFFKTLGDDIVEELAPFLSRSVPRAAVVPGESYGYPHLVREIRDVLAALKRTTEKRVKLVLLIDEVDELNSYDPRVNQKLRSLFMKSFAEDLAAVVSGVGIKKKWESEGSPWYNFFEEIEVKPFSREDAEELVKRPIRGVMQLEPGVVDAIVETTGGKPYLIQKTCIVLVNRAHEAGRRVIKRADVDLVRPSLES
jgi:tetratricopeptide (TPR) repeat protein